MLVAHKSSILTSMQGPNVADVENSVLALRPVLVQEAGNDNLQFTGGRYIDLFEQLDGEWKIALSNPFRLNRSSHTCCRTPLAIVGVGDCVTYG